MPTTTVTYNNKLGSLGGPVSFHRAGVSRFCLPDMQGHIRQLADINGNITDTFTPDAWGMQKAATGSTVNPFKAFGKWGYFTDTPSRLQVRARNLAPGTGRFISKDRAPLRTNGPYSYVQNRPLNMADPSGEISIIPYYPNLYFKIDPMKIHPDWCGVAAAKWIFLLDKQNCCKGMGYLVQKVKWTHQLDPCGNKPVETTTVYYEAWPVYDRARRSILDLFYGYTDHAETTGGDTLFGHDEQFGDVKFFCADITGDLGDPWVGRPPNEKCWGRCQFTGILPCYRVGPGCPGPDWWGKDSSCGEKPPPQRWIKSKFTCCDCPTPKHEDWSDAFPK